MSNIESQSQLARLFLGISFSQEEQTQLGEYIEQLKKDRRLKTVKWIAPKNLHMTIAFLGYLDSSQSETLITALRKNSFNLFPFSLSLHSLIALPSIPKAHVLAIELGNSEPLLRLIEQIKSILSACQLPQEDRDFLPHLTIGRIKSGGLHIDKLEKLIKPPAMNLKINGLTLFRSDLTPKGSIYTQLEQFL